MNKDHEETISFTGHTNFTEEISGEEKELNIWQEVGVAVLVLGAMWIISVGILSI